MSRRRCCCGGTCTVSFESRNPCTAGSPLVGTVNFTVKRASDGVTVLSGTTSAGGLFGPAPLEAGTYIVQGTKAGLSSTPRTVTIGCGAVVVLYLSTSIYNITIAGCPQEFGFAARRPIGATISLSGPASYTLTATAINQTLQIAGPIPGEYSYTASHPSGKLLPVSGTLTIPPGCFGVFGVTLPPAPGYTCCDASRCGNVSTGLPRKTLLVTTSAGDSWTFDGCTSNRCSFTDPVPYGPLELVTVSCGSCSYEDFPELTTAAAPCRIVLTRPTSGSWNCQLQYNTVRHFRSEPKSCANCAATAAPYLAKAWLRDYDCGATFTTGANGARVENSCDPVSFTFTFPGSDLPWSVTGPSSLITVPTPMNWLTLTELP